MLKRTFDHLSKTLGNLTDAIKDDSSQLLLQFLKEDAKQEEKSDRMFMALMHMFLMGPPQHVQQLLFNFGTSNRVRTISQSSSETPFKLFRFTVGLSHLKKLSFAQAVHI